MAAAKNISMPDDNLDALRLYIRLQCLSFTLNSRKKRLTTVAGQFIPAALFVTLVPRASY